jgi:hypothetical protein
MTPGSPAARMYNCICPEIENNFGLGNSPVLDTNQKFIITISCPVHGMSRWHVNEISPLNDAGNVTSLVYGKMSR